MAKSFRKFKNLAIDVSSEANEVIVDLLRILKSKYDYRTLSTLTGFPVSTLTRYITGRTSPKGAKAKKLLERLLNSVNVMRLIMEEGFDGNGVDLARVMLNPSMVKIIGAHVINEFTGMKITSILSLDVLSMPLASYIASATSRPMHIVSSEPISMNGDATPIIFADGGNGSARAYWLLARKNCRSESVLAVASQTPNPYFFNALVDALRKMEMELGGFFTIVAREEDLKKLRIPPGVKRSYIVLS